MQFAFAIKSQVHLQQQTQQPSAGNIQGLKVLENFVIGRVFVSFSFSFCSVSYRNLQLRFKPRALLYANIYNERFYVSALSELFHYRL